VNVKGFSARHNAIPNRFAGTYAASPIRFDDYLNSLGVTPSS